MQDVLPHLERALLDRCIVRMSVGDWWELTFGNGLWLVCQDLEAPEEAEVDALLSRASVPVLDAVDPEYAAKCVVVARNLRRRVLGVALDDDGSLRLRFERGGELCATTSTPIVDWQWALTRDGRDPYMAFEVGCFWRGEVVLPQTPKST